MIPILKDEDTVIGFLRDAISCIVTEERNGIFELQITYPLTGQLVSDIVINNLILAKPNDTSENQLFRIYEVTKPISGIFTIKAEHISYALSSYPVSNITAKSSTATAVMTLLLNKAPQNNDFSVMASDIPLQRDFAFSTGSVRSALGGTEGSVLDVYGGEYEFNNYLVCLHQNRGSDTGVIISYRKNLTDLSLTTSIEKSYTALFPYCIKDNVLTKLSDNIITVTNTTGIATKVLIKDFTSAFSTNEEINETNLRTKANNWLGNNNINEPEINLTVSFQHLWQSPEYKYLEALEKVSLCDTVTVWHSELGINIKAKVIKTVYDSIGEKYEKIELGSAKSNFTDTYQQTKQDIDEAKQIQNNLYSQITQDYINAIEDATNAITGNSGGYIVLNPPENPQELLIMNNSTIAATTKLWRFNLSGFGYSSNGYSGPYRTAITINGQINADFITTGTLSANIVRAGILTATDSSSYFNLDSGYFSTCYANITGGYISIGSSTYRTEISNGCITQYLPTSTKPVGGMVPVGNGNKYMPCVYYTENVSTAFAIAVDQSDGTFLSLAEFCPTLSKIYSPLDVYGKGHFKGDLDIGKSILTNTFAENVYRGLTHYRTTTFGGDNTSAYTAMAGFGVGNPDSRPSISLSLFNYGNTTAIARMDVFQSYGEAMIGIRGYRNGVWSHMLEIGASLWFDGNIFSSGILVSSTEEVKENIQESNSVLSLFKDSRIYTYNYKESEKTLTADTQTAIANQYNSSATEIIDNENNNLIIKEPDTITFTVTDSSEDTRVGFVIGRETPTAVISADGSHVDVYTMASITWKAVQEILTRLETAESEIQTLKGS